VFTNIKKFKISAFGQSNDYHLLTHSADSDRSGGLSADQVAKVEMSVDLASTKIGGFRGH
jgi:hypothetical protein